MPTYVCVVKAGLLKDEQSIVQAVSEISGVEESAIWVYLCNLAPDDMVEYGHVLPLPGAEQAWFEALPPDLQHDLTSLGVEKEKFVL